MTGMTCERCGATNEEADVRWVEFGTDHMSLCRCCFLGIRAIIRD